MTKLQIKKLDRAWSAQIRSFGCCEICGKTDTLNAHHIVGRRNRNVRWDLDNGMCLCSGCHTFKTQSAHQAPLWVNEKLLELFGQDWIDRLTVKSRIDCMAQKQIYEEIMATLERAV